RHSMAHVLMVGLGQLGSPLSEKLLALGHQVSAIRRGSEAPAGVHLLQQDLLRVPVVQLPSEPVDLIYIIVTPAARNALAYEEAFITLPQRVLRDRKSTRLNSSHVSISYAVFCLKKKKRINNVH